MRKDDKRKISDKDEQSLLLEIKKLRAEIAQDILKMGTNKPKDVNMISKKRKKLAIMLTFSTRNKSIKK